jgi:hypothetical protein
MRLNLKSITVFLLIVLVLVPALSAFASSNEVMFKKEVDAGYWDIWKHSDGTWQYTGKPGDEKSYDEFEITPPAEASEYQNVRYVMEIGVTKQQFMDAGGWPNAGYPPNEEGWEGFNNSYTGHIPNNYRKTGDKQVAFILAPIDGAENIREEWQADVVEGWRWYLPITVSWYGVGGEKPDFEVVLLVPGAEETTPGEAYTGTVEYKLKDNAPGPVEAILHMTHNKFGLKTPEGDKIHNKILTFQPGEEKTFQFAWTGQASDSTIRAEVWPTEPAGLSKEQRDAYPEDNVMELTVKQRNMMPDFAVTSLISGINRAEPGGNYMGTVSFKLKDTISTPTEAQIFLKHNNNSLSLNNKIIVFQPGETKTYNYSWIGQRSNTIAAEIWPTQPAGLSKEQRDAYPPDNKKQITVPTKLPPPKPGADSHAEMGRPRVPKEGTR